MSFLTSSTNLPSTAGDQSEVSPKPKGSTIPKWLPLSLLAVTTAALAVPIMLLRKQKASTLTRTLQESGPPLRRASTNMPTNGNVAQPARRQIQPKVSTSPSMPKPSAPTSTLDNDNFNGALYSAKAFGYATLMVSAGAVITVLGVKSYMGVRDTQEFAARMRLTVLTYLPQLSTRLHRQPEEDDHTGTHFNSPDIPPSVPDLASPNASGHDTEWTWPDAEARLSAAFDKDGFSGWVDAAMKELEAEGKLERARRGNT